LPTARAVQTGAVRRCGPAGGREATTRTPWTPGAAEGTDEDVLALFREYRQTHQASVFEDLVCRYLPLVRKVAHRYVRPTVSLEDLTQVGTIGLMHAVRHFDPERNVKFEAYAYSHISGQIRHYLRDDADTVQVPRWARKLYGELVQTVAQLQQELGRTPTHAEIAARMNMTEKSVDEIMRAYDTASVRSIDDTGADTGARPDLISHQRYVSFQLPVEDRIVLLQAIERLADLQRKIVYYLFYMDLSHSEVAARLGISQRHVSRVLAAALKRLSTMTHVSDLHHR
jgi:RNA polymerase sigma-B factor